MILRNSAQAATTGRKTLAAARTESHETCGRCRWHWLRVPLDYSASPSLAAFLAGNVIAGSDLSHRAAERSLPLFLRVTLQGESTNRLGATHFVTKPLECVKTETSLHVLAYNLKRVTKILETGS